MRHERFAAFILTHGRPDRVHTYETLRASGYTGAIVLVVDDEDATADRYRENFPGEVWEFEKAAAARSFDEADNFDDRRAIAYARNSCWDLAREIGVDHFVQLDDDYVDFRHKRNAAGEYIDKRDIRDLDAVFDAMLDYFETIPALAIAMAQGGDFFGGAEGSWSIPTRKCMNSFLCATDRPFRFVGRVNEDVNTYTSVAARGALFLTIKDVALQQKATQSNAGGMTDLYLDSGTYIKSFYSVMQAPSAVRISVMHSAHARIHHKVRWRYAVPQIVRESDRKPRV